MKAKNHPKLTVEETPRTDQERNLVDQLTWMTQGTTTEDCRTLVNLVRLLVENTGNDMVVGTGGSHIWIHRRSEFRNGENSHAENKRFAIITD